MADKLKLYEDSDWPDHGQNAEELIGATIDELNNNANNPDPAVRMMAALVQSNLAVAEATLELSDKMQQIADRVSEATGGW